MTDKRIQERFHRNAKTHPGREFAFCWNGFKRDRIYRKMDLLEVDIAFDMSGSKLRSGSSYWKKRDENPSCLQRLLSFLGC